MSIFHELQFTPTPLVGILVLLGLATQEIRVIHQGVFLFGWQKVVV